MDSVINIVALLGLWMPHDFAGPHSYIYFPFKLIEFSENKTAVFYENSISNYALNFKIDENKIIVDSCCTFFNVSIEGDTITALIGDEIGNSFPIKLKKIGETIIISHSYSFMLNQIVSYRINDKYINPFILETITVNDNASNFKFKFSVILIKKSLFLIHWAGALEIGYYPIETLADNFMSIIVPRHNSLLVLTRL